jgi:hypothetical protein
MALPEKSYFYLTQIARRWQTDIADLRDYAEQGQLEVQVWLDDSVLKVYRLKKTEDGETAAIPTGVTGHRGYVIVEPFELRKIFREQKAAIKKFASLDRRDLFKLHPQSECHPVAVDDLMISRVERDRFEIANQIVPVNGALGLTSANKTGIEATSAGRPSIMKRITKHHLSRVAKGETLPTMTAEAHYLRNWARDTLQGVQVPAVKTIMNNLSASLPK